MSQKRISAPYCHRPSVNNDHLFRTSSITEATDSILEHAIEVQVRTVVRDAAEVLGRYSFIVDEDGDMLVSVHEIQGQRGWYIEAAGPGMLVERPYSTQPIAKADLDEWEQRYLNDEGIVIRGRVPGEATFIKIKREPVPHAINRAAMAAVAGFQAVIAGHVN